MLIISAWARQHTALLIVAAAILSASHCGYQKSHCSHSQPSTENEKSQSWQAVKPSTCVDFIGKQCQLLGLFLWCQNKSLSVTISSLQLWISNYTDSTAHYNVPCVMRGTDSYAYVHAYAWHCIGWNELLGSDLVSGYNGSSFYSIWLLADPSGSFIKSASRGFFTAHIRMYGSKLCSVTIHKCFWKCRIKSQCHITPNKVLKKVVLQTSA